MLVVIGQSCHIWLYCKASSLFGGSVVYLFVFCVKFVYTYSAHIRCLLGRCLGLMLYYLHTPACWQPSFNDTPITRTCQIAEPEHQCLDRHMMYSYWNFYAIMPCLTIPAVMHKRDTAQISQYNTLALLRAWLANVKTETYPDQLVCRECMSLLEDALHTIKLDYITRQHCGTFISPR